jgi:hypothetical protein
LHVTGRFSIFATLKKFLAISFAFVYLLISSGLLVEVHHCMGRIADAGLTIFTSHADNDKCGKCGMDKGKESQHCCKDEYKQVKIASDQKFSSIQYLIEAPVTLLAGFTLPARHETITSQESVTAYRLRPPPKLPSAQSLLCVFRI